MNKHLFRAEYGMTATGNLLCKNLDYYDVSVEAILIA